MPCHKATFIHIKAMTGSSYCLLLHSEDLSEELSKEESRIMQRAQHTVLEVLEDMLRKDQVLIQNLKVVVVLAGEGEGWVQRYAMLTEMLLSQAAFQKKTHKARSCAYKKIKVILEKQGWPKERLSLMHGPS